MYVFTSAATATTSARMEPMDTSAVLWAASSAVPAALASSVVTLVTTGFFVQFFCVSARPTARGLADGGTTVPTKIDSSRTAGFIPYYSLGRYRSTSRALVLEPLLMVPPLSP